MRYSLVIIFLAALSYSGYSQFNPPKVYLQNKTLTYDQLIAEYQKLADASPKAQLIKYGKTDSGKPLHLFVISNFKEFNPKILHKDNMRIVLINNGIHPGEPAGMEASLQLAADLLGKRDSIAEILKNTVVCIIPAYNIGGMLNRSPYNRANQDGPEECGFRGNARNIDLNRDFIACQTENAKAFTKIFQEWKPDIFLETHTTDGSDHQNTMTLITTMYEDLPPVLGNYLHKTMEPALFSLMKQNSKYLMCPYVNVWRKTPDEGYPQFEDIPRYSTGYTSLFNTLSFITENHIFKSFQDRVESCRDFMHCLLQYTSDHSAEIADYIDQADQYLKKQNEFVLQWKIDSSKYDMISFNGFEASYPPSKLTGQPLLHYNREKPYTKKIKYYDYYNPVYTVKAPEYYIVPQAWKEAVKRLAWNKADMKRLSADVSVEAEMYYIDEYKTSDEPYNGHYLHNNVTVKPTVINVNFSKGDYVVSVKGRESDYIIQALEPEAPDSYFAWNMFDEILQSREYFSPFIFEDRAMQILDTTPGLKEKLKEQIELDSTLQKDTYRQMQFIYRNSPYFEKTYMRYPVARINAKIELPVVSEKEYKEKF